MVAAGAAPAIVLPAAPTDRTKTVPNTGINTGFSGYLAPSNLIVTCARPPCCACVRQSFCFDASRPSPCSSCRQRRPGAQPSRRISSYPARTHCVPFHKPPDSILEMNNTELINNPRDLPPNLTYEKGVPFFGFLDTSRDLAQRKTFWPKPYRSSASHKTTYSPTEIER